MSQAPPAGLQALITILAELVAEELIAAEQTSTVASDDEPARADDQSSKRSKNKRR